MRVERLFLCGVVVLASVLTLSGQNSDTSKKSSAQNLPPFIVSGLDAYKQKGPEEAFRAWMKNSAIEGSKDALSQANILRQVQDFYGSYQDFEVISTRDISPRVKAIYLELDYEKGPVFAKFVAYRTEKEWILAYFNFNTKEELILPASQ